MRVLMINGSPREKGCTYTALREVAKPLEEQGIEVKMLSIGSAPVRGCMACRKCSELKRCVLDDDACNAWIEEAKAADGIVIGSPVYYGGPNGALCALLDRMFFACPNEHFVLKPAAAVVSCRRAGSTAALDRLYKYFTLNQMAVVTSQYWSMVHGNTPDEVRQDIEGMQVMRALGQNMGYILRSMAEGGVERPVVPPKTATNFIR